MVFTFDATATTTTETVAFETLTKDKREIAVHADIEDLGQTVLIDDTPPTEDIPRIGTELTDATDGDHVIEPSKTTELIDTVTYSGLTPGVEYTMVGMLMDKSTGKPLTVNGERVTAQTVFTPTESHGEVQVTFTFDSTVIETTEMVAFEGCAKDGAEVAIHADINDKGQTVTMNNPELPETGFFGKTGTLWLLAVVGGCLVLAVCAALGLVTTRRRQ